MQTAFGPDGAKEDVLANHMQFQPIPDISADGTTGWVRSRAYVMSNAGWGLPLYENEYEKGEDGIWRISRLSGPFTMYTSWDGWGKNALNNTWPDKFEPAAGPAAVDGLPDLSGLLHRAVPLSEPGDRQAVRARLGQVGAYHRPPGTPEQAASLQVGRLADGTQPIAEPPRD